ncbi:hypothetical protein D1013_14540 [Euzebyella marina]|uniref:Metal-dependent hydrolase n=1 Tax=Euzebyella marina TaxID=1761453 RepID=A0A3G2L8J4_9FLAO|nr:DUF6122 family protein [Euzebyella marina]AYN68513.1 hypothetical protein D1013_14540 [Euzebyella marina]
MIRFLVHYGIHFLVPIIIAISFFRSNRLKVALILLGGILIDIDHLLATPVFDANRCSIGFHPLHSYWAIALYLGLLFFKKTRIVGLALLIHIVADMADCLLMFQTK